MKVPKAEGGVRMLAIHKDLLLIGTTTNAILTAPAAEKGNPIGGALLNKMPLTQVGMHRKFPLKLSWILHSTYDNQL